MLELESRLGWCGVARMTRLGLSLSLFIERGGVGERRKVVEVGMWRVDVGWRELRVGIDGCMGGMDHC